jgi:translocation and assembly module TamA
LFVRACTFLLWLAIFCAASAQALMVGVDAPEPLKALLAQHLDIARAARLNETSDADEVARLAQQSDLTAHELLATEGYFSPQIKHMATQSAGDWRVEYRVVPGTRTTVRRVALNFTGAVQTRVDADKLRTRIEREFVFKSGMPFRQADWDRAKLGVLQPLLASAYPAARITSSEARIDPATHTADLTLSIDSGPAFFYGAPQLSGNQRYPASVALNLNPAKRGQPVRQQDLLDYQTALESSGYFAQAAVRINPDPAQAAAVPIEVVVVERPQKLLSFGVGISTDTGARVQASWLQRDLADHGLRLKLDARIETSQQSGAAELAWPRTSQGYENSIGAQLKHEDIKGQQTRTNLLIAKRSRTRGQIETTLSLQYQTEAQRIAKVLSENNQALTLNYAWTLRTLGRALYPRSGYVLSLQGGGAAAGVLSDTSFVRLYARDTQFFGLGRNARLIVRGEFGGVLADTRDGIPTDFLFRAGGDNSIRGYAYQSLGRSTSGGVASVRYLATASVEYNYFFNNTWGAALFVDAGDAADTPRSLSPVFGYGVGARYRSPVGPINLDLAYGEATRQFRLHFSLGVSF